MKKLRILLWITMLFGFSILTYGQEEPPKLYNPEADAAADIMEAVKTANENGKHVFLQIGGNWCGWCIKFHKFCKEDEEITKYVKENFEIVKVNYGPKNKNLDVLEDLEYPQRFGFPVFVILDNSGQRLHTQDTGYLEEGKTYNKDKVLKFFKNWSPEALDPETHKKK